MSERHLLFSAMDDSRRLTREAAMAGKILLRWLGVNSIRSRVVAYFDFLCDPLRCPRFFLCGLMPRTLGKTAEDTEDFAENAEKNSN